MLKSNSQKVSAKPEAGRTKRKYTKKAHLLKEK